MGISDAGGNGRVAVIPTDTSGIAGTTQTPEPAWYGADKDLGEFVTTKGWKGPQDAITSYRNLESEHGKVGGRVKQLEDFYEQNITPYWDQYVEWAKAQAAAGDGGNSGTPPAGKETNEDRLLKQVQALLEQKLSPLTDWKKQSDERSWAQARDGASRRFVSKYPEAEQYQKEINELITSGRVSVSDRLSEAATFAALDDAYKIARSERMLKDEAAKKAGSVEGGSGGRGREETGVGLTRDQMRERLTQSH